MSFKLWRVKKKERYEITTHVVTTGEIENFNAAVKYVEGIITQGKPKNIIPKIELVYNNNNKCNEKLKVDDAHLTYLLKKIRKRFEEHISIPLLNESIPFSFELYCDELKAANLTEDIDKILNEAVASANFTEEQKDEFTPRWINLVEKREPRMMIGDILKNS